MQIPRGGWGVRCTSALLQLRLLEMVLQWKTLRAIRHNQIWHVGITARRRSLSSALRASQCLVCVQVSVGMHQCRVQLSPLFPRWATVIDRANAALSFLLQPCISAMRHTPHQNFSRIFTIVHSDCYSVERQPSSQLIALIMQGMFLKTKLKNWKFEKLKNRSSFLLPQQMKAFLLWALWSTLFYIFALMCVSMLSNGSWQYQGTCTKSDCKYKSALPAASFSFQRARDSLTPQTRFTF